ncbi:exonuclease SbcCD subunit D [Thomasclavelia spiroformis]|uniref:exonuclease SbcCD subunit D n=1 Tax=Thomasclavelia spiroformis TaxID=29348 RepID=UPI00241CF7C3|nr:exonuclease SbcCD subunit D [Thomasclavelia spiroformis]MBS6116295.1 exonuclease SbcCD subunit D [Thomasclavelia spiroformis]
MRFLHISDIHLGKLLFQQNLLEIQIDLLNQIIDYLVDNDIDVLIMAGDIYDRSVPSNEAIEALNDFLSSLILKHHKKVLMIAGNHDSATRLSFASGLLKQEGLYIEAFVQEEMKPVVIDGVNFYLLPFFKPSYLRYLYNDESIITYQDAFAAYMKRQKINPDKTNVLITHQFIAGNKEVIKSESEAILSVGGSEIIDVSLVKQFDYVALGHIHAPQQISCDAIRYSGSLMRYSFDEVKQKKSIVDVSIANKKVTYQLIELKPKQDLIKITGYFDEVMNYDNNHNDFIAVELLDTKIVPNAIDYLRKKYENVLQITYPNLISKQITNNTKADVGFEKLSSLELFEQFYEKIKGSKLDKEAKALVAEILKEEHNSDTK